MKAKKKFAPKAKTKIATPVKAEPIPVPESPDAAGLSRTASANSESVNELLEEGNAFEAAVVSGVEKADSNDEVRTREVPEDDVPPEYRDEGELPR